MKDKRKSAPFAARASVVIAGTLLLVLIVPPARLAAQAATTPGFLNFPAFNPPPFDFNNVF